jgi:8-oxo-dGTP pyrophosphatase MutT (NUDIX family)
MARQHTSGDGTEKTQVFKVVKQIEASVAIIEDPLGCGNSTYMLLKRHDHDRTCKGWCLPGGSIEPGETPEQAVVREVKEETGLTVGIRRKLFREKATVNGIPFLIHAFITFVKCGEICDFPSEEHDSMIILDTVPNLPGIGALTLRAIKEHLWLPR